MLNSQFVKLPSNLEVKFLCSCFFLKHIFLIIIQDCVYQQSQNFQCLFWQFTHIPSRSMGLICKFMINFELFLTHFFTILSLTKTEAGVQQSIGRRPQKAPTARDSDAECKSSGLFFLFLAFLPLNSSY